jgi:hypothetical protein
MTERGGTAHSEGTMMMTTKLNFARDIENAMKALRSVIKDFSYGVEGTERLEEALDLLERADEIVWYVDEEASQTPLCELIEPWETKFRPAANVAAAHAAALADAVGKVLP